MKTTVRLICIVLLLFICTFLAFIFNYTLIQKLIDKGYATDAKKYETNYFFNLFYEVSSNTAYLPEPTPINFVVTIIIGFILGSWFSWLLFRKKKHK